MAKYSRGTFAYLTVDGERVPAVADDTVWNLIGHSFFRSIALDNEVLISKVEVQITIDISDSDAHALISDLRRFVGSGLALSVAKQIEGQITPKMQEPEKVGSVVVDADGVHWTKYADGEDNKANWINEHAVLDHWNDIVYPKTV